VIVLAFGNVCSFVLAPRLHSHPVARGPAVGRRSAPRE